MNSYKLKYVKYKLKYEKLTQKGGDNVPLFKILNYNNSFLTNKLQYRNRDRLIDLNINEVLAGQTVIKGYIINSVIYRIYNKPSESNNTKQNIISDWRKIVNDNNDIKSLISLIFDLDYSIASINNSIAIIPMWLRTEFSQLLADSQKIPNSDKNYKFLDQPQEVLKNCFLTPFDIIFSHYYLNKKSNNNINLNNNNLIFKSNKTFTNHNPSIGQWRIAGSNTRNLNVTEMFCLSLYTSAGLYKIINFIYRMGKDDIGSEGLKAYFTNFQYYIPYIWNKLHPTMIPENKNIYRGVDSQLLLSNDYSDLQKFFSIFGNEKKDNYNNLYYIKFNQLILSGTSSGNTALEYCKDQNGILTKFELNTSNHNIPNNNNPAPLRNKSFNSSFRNIPDEYSLCGAQTNVSCNEYICIPSLTRPYFLIADWDFNKTVPNHYYLVLREVYKLRNNATVLNL